MTTAAPSTALVMIQPIFTDSERARPRRVPGRVPGLTREAYALDLRQFTTWCRTRSLPLSAVRRAGIDSFARDLGARGRARATVTRRLCTIAGSWPRTAGGWTGTPPPSSPPTSRAPPGKGIPARTAPPGCGSRRTKLPS